MEEEVHGQLKTNNTVLTLQLAGLVKEIYLCGREREGEGGERWRKRGETEEVKSRMWRDDSSRTVQQCT